jgi:murein DD-endopeptidase MepM/ murein hydrolase activator NlpD
MVVLTVCTLVVFMSAMVTPFSFVGAQESADELRQKISDSQAQLAAIDAEIKKYESQLNQVGAEKKTLQSAIHELDLSRQKIQADVRATQTKISSTDLEIEELDREIQVKQLEVDRNLGAVAASFRAIDQAENESMVELVFAQDSFAEMWNTLEEQSMLQTSLRDDVRALNALKAEYEQAKQRSLTKRDQLGTLQETLTGKQTALDETRGQKDQLLSATQNKESNYQKILAEKKAAREKFDAEINAYEAKLKFILDPSSIPSVGSGVLRWPFDPAYMANCPNYQSALGNSQCITQYFGNTTFAKAGAYNGQGHNGVDFRAPTGTDVHAALDGEVQEINQGVAPNCQYGKWVLIKHHNGLTTLYAHLSSISVAKGQSVTTGQIIGYSGSTGYATGPHLHLTVYASDAVSFKQYTCNSGPTVAVPVAAFSGYLNPLDYL